MSTGTQIHQWDFHGGNSQRWIFALLSDGYYTIKSANSSGAYYLGVENDSIDNNIPIVLRTGSVSDGMKWKVTVASGGAYKITPKTGEANDRVLAVGAYAANVNGIDIQQRDYVNDDNYKDEWELTKIQYSATVYNFFDKGYYIRYGETELTSIEKINSYTDEVAKQYLKLFGLVLTAPTATYYCSAIDTCKKNVSSDNINDLCSHTILFNSTDSVSTHFTNNTSPSGSNCITKAYWSGHRIQTYSNVNEYNRCYSSETNIFMLELSSSFVRNRDSKGILMHELNHQYGANDHYHEILDKGTPNERCRGGNICSECGTNSRPSSCIMNQSRIDITAETVICPECKEDIYFHLEGHH